MNGIDAKSLCERRQTHLRKRAITKLGWAGQMRLYVGDFIFSTSSRISLCQNHLHLPRWASVSLVEKYGRKGSIFILVNENCNILIGLLLLVLVDEWKLFLCRRLSFIPPCSAKRTDMLPHIKRRGGDEDQKGLHEKICNQLWSTKNCKFSLVFIVI